MSSGQETGLEPVTGQSMEQQHAARARIHSRPRARLIYNPSSGRETMRHVLSDVLDILETSGLEVSCHRTRAGGDAVDEARAAAQAGFEYVIAAGGDGTVNEVINGLATEEEEIRPILGILPAGTTNDLARALGLPRDLHQAARVIAERNPRPLDIGRMTSIREDRLHDLLPADPAAASTADAEEIRYFINIAGCGHMTEITYEVPSRQKTILGTLAYYFKGLEKIPQLRPIQIALHSEEFQFTGKAMLCLIANSNSVAGFEKLAPQAIIHDGLLDVVLVHDVNLAELIRLAVLAQRGDHIADDRVVYFQTKRLDIASPDLVQVNIDGELGGWLPKTFEVLKHHLQILS